MGECEKQCVEREKQYGERGKQCGESEKGSLQICPPSYIQSNGLLVGWLVATCARLLTKRRLCAKYDRQKAGSEAESSSCAMTEANACVSVGEYDHSARIKLTSVLPDSP